MKNCSLVFAFKSDIFITEILNVRTAISDTMVLRHRGVRYGIIGGERSEGEEDGDDEGHQKAAGAEGKPCQKTENGQGGV